jgi:hypothetical protein
MRRSGLRSAPLVLAVLMLVTFANATVKAVGAQPAPASPPLVSPPLVTLPLAGTTSGNGTFSGTLAISSVGSDSGGVFVEGLVTGTVTRANSKTPVGTIVSVPVRLPLQGNWPGGGLAQQAPGDSIVLAQATCAILHLEIGAVNLNVLGVVVTTSPIALDVSGDPAGALGALVCSILNLAGGLAGLVNLLTSLLGALGGALGGVVPTV